MKRTKHIVKMFESVEDIFDILESNISRLDELAPDYSNRELIDEDDYDEIVDEWIELSEIEIDAIELINDHFVIKVEDWLDDKKIFNKWKCTIANPNELVYDVITRKTYNHSHWEIIIDFKNDLITIAMI